MKRFPKEFAELLSPPGRQLLDGEGPWAGVLKTGRRMALMPRLLDARKAQDCLALLESSFGLADLFRMEERIPPESIWGMTENYEERLPKTVRVWTALFQTRKAAAFGIAQKLGLLDLLQSASLHRFAEALSGRPLRKANGVQLLCYTQGDYAGPHNDHHPENPEAADGYLDLHLTFCNPHVKRQLLVYEKGGHLTEVASVRTVGGLSAYRLPFWHYTTPLEAKPRQSLVARRWVLLSTFIDRKTRQAPGR